MLKFVEGDTAAAGSSAESVSLTLSVTRKTNTGGGGLSGASVEI